MNNTTRKLQAVELAMLEEIDKICRDNGINYFLMYGTLLGAVRHKGFIPWDDDIDIGMLREDYEKFIDVFCRIKKSNLFLQISETEPNYIYPFVKIRKNDTLATEYATKNLPIHQGIFIDVFPIDKTSDSFILSVLQYHAIFVCTKILYTHFFDMKKISIRMSVHKLLSFPVIFLFGRRNIIKFANKIAEIFNKKETKNCVSFFDSYSRIRNTFPISTYQNLVQYSFEGSLFPGPENYQEHLSTIYGDYLTLPSPKDRVSHNFMELKF